MILILSHLEMAIADYEIEAMGTVSQVLLKTLKWFQWRIF